MIETDEGAEVVYTGSWASHGKHTTWDGAWDIQGDRGGLLWAENRVEIRFASLFDTVFMPGAFEREGIMEVELDELEFEERAGTLTEFAAAIREDRPAETHARDNLKSLALVLAAVESAKCGGKEIELEAFRNAQKV
jgi:predicted dehydrogenase